MNSSPFTVPSQPNQASYPASDLNCLPTYTYESYLTQFGGAPPWNPANPEQFWFDPAAPTTPGALYSPAGNTGPGGLGYLGISMVNGVPVQAPVYITGSQAGTVNIPSPYVAAGNSTPLPVPTRPLVPSGQPSAETLSVSPDGAGPGISEIMVSRADLEGTVPATLTSAQVQTLLQGAADIAAVRAKLGA